MPQSLLFIVKASILERKKTLIINPDFLALGTKSFSSGQITGVRYGVKEIYGYRFRIGRVYSIDVRDDTGNIMKIRLKSLYRIGIKRLEKKYLTILRAIFDNYTHNISVNLINQFLNGTEISILNVCFTRDGIVLGQNREIIYWQQLGTKAYWTYYSLFLNSHPDNYKTFEYLTDWNTIVLRTVINHILKVKDLSNK